MRSMPTTHTTGARKRDTKLVKLRAAALFAFYPLQLPCRTQPCRIRLRAAARLFAFYPVHPPSRLRLR